MWGREKEWITSQVLWRAGGGVVPSFNQEFSPSIFTARGCEVSVKRLSSSTGAQVSLLGLGALLAQRCLS